MTNSEKPVDTLHELTLGEFQDRMLLESLEKYGLDKNKVDIVQRVSDAIYDFSQTIPPFGADADEEKLILMTVFRMAHLSLENYFARKERTLREGGDK